MRLHTFARKLPGPVKQALKRAYGMVPPRLRFSRTFWETYNFLQESQWWDTARLHDYQMRELQRLLVHCYEHVPYYHRVFDERGLTPADMQSLADLSKLPCLRKEQIRREPQAFMARNRRTDRLENRDTSGTSGEPFQFYVDHDELEREWAFVCHQWSRVGYQPGDVRVDLRGRYTRGARPCEWDPVQRALRLAPVVKEKETVRLYLDMIRSYKPRFLCGYPSAVTHFVSLVRQYKFAVDVRLTAVLFVSETLYPWQRALVEEVFACRSYNFYGMAEHVVMAGECETSPMLHCVPQYGITEVDPQTGEIIGTGFLNYANPFIRYRTTDIASRPLGSICPKCGRQYHPVLPDIDGRLQDFIVTPDGMLIGGCILEYPFDASKTIAHVQLVQESLDRVTLRAAPIDESCVALFAEELALARESVQQILGSGVTIRSERMSAEEYAGSGKLRFIVSHVSHELSCGDRSSRMCNDVGLT